MRTPLGHLELELVLVEDDPDQPPDGPIVLLSTGAGVGVSLVGEHVGQLAEDEPQDGADFTLGGQAEGATR